MYKRGIKIKGFTLVELMVSIAIFIVMTMLFLIKNGQYNDNVMLTNLSYDVALAIREAQSDALNVKFSTTTGSLADGYKYGYGVSFDLTTTANQGKFTFFADNPSAGNQFFYDNSDTIIKTYNIKNGNLISGFCVTSSTSCVPAKPFSVSSINYNNVVISFLRPDAKSHIRVVAAGPDFNYAKIELKSPTGATSSVVVRKTGQIIVGDE